MLISECPEARYLQPTEGEPRYLLPNEEVVYSCVEECRDSFEVVTLRGENFCFGNDTWDLSYCALCSVFILGCGIVNCVHCVQRGGALQCEECIEGYHPYPVESVDNICITEEEFESNNIICM